MLEANDGAQAAGWPAFHKSTVHTSPMLYDLDFDGIQDILLATYDGEILAFRDNVRAPRCSLPTRQLQEVCTSVSCYRCLTPEAANACWHVWPKHAQVVVLVQGEQMAERLQVPKLRVRRDWYKGLAADHVDHSHPDVGADATAAPTPAAQVSCASSSTGTGTISGNRPSQRCRNAQHNLMWLALASRIET